MKVIIRAVRFFAPLFLLVFLSLIVWSQEICSPRYEINKNSEGLFEVIDCQTSELVAVFDQDPRMESYEPPQLNAYPYLLGFPIYYNFAGRWNPNVGDFFDSGEKEVVLNVGNDPSTHKLYMYNSSGQLKNNFPIYSCAFDVSAYDYGQDGTLDIFYRYADYDQYPVPAGMGCVDANANQLPYWPQLGPLTNALDDVNSDGIAEVFSPSFTGSSPYYARVYGYDEKGNILQGWPRDFSYQEYSPQLSTMAIADLDNDGQKEIIVALNTTDTTILALKPDGSNAPGFPVSLNLGKPEESPIVGDIDSDGWQEIIIGTYSGWLAVLNHDGTAKTGWPQKTYFGSYNPACGGLQKCGGGVAGVSIGDLKQDGDLEIAVGTDNGYGNALMMIFKSDGNYTSFIGWPIVLPTNSGACAPAIGDIDGDCQVDLVYPVSKIPANQSGIYAYHLDGQLISGFPCYTATNITGGGQTPLLTDLNNDGYLDIGIATDSIGSPFGTLEFFNLAPNPYNRSCIEWPMAHFDIRNTGRYRKLYQIDKNSSFTVDKTAIPADGESKMLLTACATTEGQLPSNFNGDLSGQDVRFARNPKNGEFTGPIIDWGNGSYSRYIQAPLSDDPLTTNLMCWINEFKLNTIIPVTFWGRPVVSSFSPQVVRAGSSYTISITGRNYPSDITAVSDSPDTQITGLNRVSDTEAQINVNVSSSAVGYQDLKLFGYQRYSDPISLIAYQPEDLLLLGTKPNLTDAEMNWYGLEEPPGITFKLIRATKPDFSDAITIYEGTNRNYIDSEIPNQIYYYKVEY